jgi:hypothetical protein
MQYRLTLRMGIEADEIERIPGEELVNYAQSLGFTTEEPQVNPTPRVQPDYASINAVKSICRPWIEIWSGDEWGDVMHPLYDAIHTDYGLSDEDVAQLTQILCDNVVSMHEWMLNEGMDYGVCTEEDMENAAKEARESRDYWLNGGNLTSFDHAKRVAKETVDTLPRWLFGES